MLVGSFSNGSRLLHGLCKNNVLGFFSLWRQHGIDKAAPYGFSYSKKKIKDIYPELKDKTGTTIKNSKSIAKNSVGDNPLTKIHLLVDDLISQSKR